MAWDPVDRTRALLGERIPDGGTAEDTYFSELEISNLLDEAGGNSRRAAYEGWQIKAAYYADLCNVTEGNALREASDLLDHALKMVSQFDGPGTSRTAGRTRVGRIIRRD